MKRYITIFSIILCIFSLTNTSFAKSNKNQKEYFVAFNTQENIDTKLIKELNGKVNKKFKHLPVITAELSESRIQELINNPKIEYVEEVGTVTAHSETTLNQEIPWGIEHLQIDEIHKSNITGKGIKIGILDSGINYNHQDLLISGGVNFVSEGQDYTDYYGHGTVVAGIISALDNQTGILGTAPEAQVYGIKVLDNTGSGDYSDIIQGIEWAINNDIKVLNMSFGGTQRSKTLEKSINNAYNNGILLIASAGNKGYSKKGTITYPAAYDSVIAVGAIDQLNERATFSSVGKDLELMAPGIYIKSTSIEGYSLNHGTSMAAPYVSGIAALIWQSNPNLSNIELRNLLNNNALKLGDKFYYGNGLVNAETLIK